VVRAAAAAQRKYFFDSHGGLWVTCDPCEPGAMAFGPRWTAREADPREIWGVWETLHEYGTPRIGAGSLYEEVRRMGFLETKEDGWTYLR
jgi:hypothetical protein